MRKRNTPGPVTGAGTVSIRGVTLPVQYSLATLPTVAGPTSQHKMVKGAIEIDPDMARDAFRAGQLTLQTEEGQAIRVQVVAHTEGSRTAYVESLR